VSRQANPTVIGGFVLGALALIVTGILVFSSGAWFRERIYLVTYFPGSVQGLSVGAQVQFQGVPIGQVVDIGLDYVADRDSFRIPVRYEVWPKTIHVLGDIEVSDPRDLLRRLVDERGLRAQLESVSFVTGQYLVSLSMNPSLPSRSYKASEDGTIRVPAIAAIRDRVQEMLDNLRLNELVDTATQTLQAIGTLASSDELSSAISNLDMALARIPGFIERIEQQIGPLSEQADTTLEEYQQLAESLHGQARPLLRTLNEAAAEFSSIAQELGGELGPVAASARNALDETAEAMRSIRQLAGEGSATRYELDRLLAAATSAARSVRSLADYLERHPEALLQGKR
jgi:paraquat-inducible protein B